MSQSLKEILSGNNPAAVLRALYAEGKLGQVDSSLPALRMEIPKGYRHKDNLEHSFRVLENAISRETKGKDILLRTAALFHDIGKPATRKFGPRGVVTFENHEAVGAKMVRTILRKHGYSKDEIAVVSRLVFLHMRSHNFDSAGWTDSAVRRFMTDAGDLFDRLVILFYSDVTSGIAETRKKVHDSIDTLVAEAERVRKNDARKALRPSIDGHEVMDMYGLTPGRELGQIMKFLNSDEGISLTRETVFSEIESRFNLTRKN